LTFGVSRVWLVNNLWESIAQLVVLEQAGNINEGWVCVTRGVVVRGIDD